MLSMLGFFTLLAVLAPLFGADSRDGLDWAGHHFFRPGDPDRADTGPEVLRTSDSPAPAGVARAAAAGCRTAPAAG